MNQEALKNNILIREKQLENLKDLNLHLELLHEEHNFSKETWNDIQARISSKFAQLEISIRDHKKDLK